MDANVSFTGNLGTDVEMKIGEGWRGARFRVAHTPRAMRQGEWVDGTTTWLSVHVYGRLADNCAASLHKGDPVMVTGRLRTRNWIDDEGSHEQLIIVASSVGPDLSRVSAVCRRPEKRVEAPLGDDHVLRYQEPHDAIGDDGDAEMVDDDVELVGS
ncbi:MAG: single-stranded DNA-binding protein [Cutibacterium avidum]|uniref:single-stranded DNA-binding protein n=1 Tax=Cutibacterium avidum TaxID=33010 RepID=UPI0003B8568E|nr:single-stranded DNA-binding protein [Cutibacterium avidum]ERS24891.1 hypothetical protein HMPREF1301_00277 [Propionibacterium sp. KPL2005]ERS26790.1 hypothetical protein HMPREF1297_02381 [Propionibacterium sp. KPL2000]MCG7370050.1 single-stranded DNA-binding protein [Cutibacterium avidum]MDU4921542.1 single-stranded DNA-binding protein [Cutibacterium avidum]MDU7387581.1 single-stranded DNA-binding protein [Cutibacterium avidum]